MKKEYFSIPNLLGYFRILMLPIFLYQYYHADSTAEYAFTFLLLTIIFISDAVDGFVARKFNMITDFGKMLDPVADKLVQGALALAVAFRHPMMKVFFVIFLCKELYMGIMGLYLIKAKDSLNGAQWYGKVCTAVVDVCILILLFVPNLSAKISTIIIAFMIGLELFALIMYLHFHISIIREKK